VATPLVETPEGWLMIYHGVKETVAGSLYRVGLALLDLDDPTRCIRRGKEWIFTPRAHYEFDGDVGNVVFPCGYTLDDEGDTLNLYTMAWRTPVWRWRRAALDRCWIG
jgi:beta-1,4-mannooligosaccharide/beta-1,4-mannosyl-N-acetylglucosamine phosphorylase